MESLNSPSRENEEMFESFGENVLLETPETPSSRTIRHQRRHEINALEAQIKDLQTRLAELRGVDAQNSRDRTQNINSDRNQQDIGRGIRSVATSPLRRKCRDHRSSSWLPVEVERIVNRLVNEKLESRKQTTFPNLHDKEKKKPNFPTKFRKIVSHVGLVDQVITLLENVKPILGTYDPVDLRFKFMQALPWDLQASVGRAGKADIYQIVDSLEKMFGHPVLLDAAEEKLLDYSCDSALSLTSNICEFVRMAERHNMRCDAAGSNHDRRTWTMRKILKHVTENLVHHNEARVDFYKTYLDRAKTMNMEQWTVIDVQAIVSEVELRHQIHRNVKSKSSGKVMVLVSQKNRNRFSKTKDKPHRQKRGEKNTKPGLKKSFLQEKCGWQSIG